MLVRLAPVTRALLVSLLVACNPAESGAPGDTEDTGDTGFEGDPEVFSELSAPVDIHIDDRGVPHIYGETDADVFFAAGYQVAVDRLFQMDLMRRRAYGRGAEVLGEGKVDEDRISRLFNFARWGKLDAERLKKESPEEYHLFVAWTAGVNRRIEEINSGAAPLPYGFGKAELDYSPEPWDPVDTLVIGKMVSFGNSNVLEYEFLATVVTRFVPQVLEVVQLPRPGWEAYTVPPEDRPSAATAPAPGGAEPTRTSGQVAKNRSQEPARTLPPDAAASLRRLHDALSGFRVVGSNNWAVDGRFTASGKPLIANDPHQPLQSPSVMYAVHLNSADAGGDFDVAGFGFAGVPGVQLGHNRKIHWSATTGFADCMDLYSVTLAPDQATISIGGKTAPVVWRDEVIKVAGMGDRTFRVGDVEGYGVLVGDALPLDPALVVDAARRLLINWTGFRATNEARAFLRMGKAQSIDEWEKAVDMIEVGTFNWMAADATGITYHLNTNVPDRGAPAGRPMPIRVVDGDDPAYVWNGKFLPGNQLPRSRAPQTGFIVTANNDPWGFTGDGDLSNDPWYYGAFYDPGYRAGRVEQRLQELTQAGKVTVADMQSVQSDTHSLVADKMLPVLAEVYAKVATDDTLLAFRGRKDLEVLHDLLTKQWNRRMDRQESGALAFHVFAHFLVQRIFEDDLSLVFGAIMDASPVYALKFAALAATGMYPNANELMQEGRDLLVMEALVDTAEWLTAEFGSVSPHRYRWGDRHGTGFRNAYGGELDGGWHPTDGGEDTVNVSGSSFFEPESTDVRPRFESNDGAVFRVITGFDGEGVPQAVVNFPPGNSADPTSPHFADTLEDWIEDRYHHYPYRRHEVEAATRETVTLEP
ncbi:penicillin amidase [Nannocystis exedens]|uniref:Penicillin amidase n=1 Tax=Nannocystis exedens TaxID=54 RepID=A0A1I1T825_9BACT|nr:penicillin acylase family protein [Nannocystis exedens]PCC66723.1 penicillin amidase [Nannocystis exedens]SFD54742.1 penicillin amidase [Nannocystis exedens]